MYDFTDKSVRNSILLEFYRIKFTFTAFRNKNVEKEPYIGCHSVKQPTPEPIKILENIPVFMVEFCSDRTYHQTQTIGFQVFV